ncbi:MAG: efflux RND transporter periplasmic adaptor subunit [Coriobacteriia bacterium]|nr:efflux RND transporter periplasmic adaptor subunit [Coriobacteriia bacterium]
MSKKVKILIGVIIAVLVISLVAFGLAKNSGTSVQASTVKSSSLAVTVMGSGKVTAGSKADVYPGAQGIIEKLYVKEGDEVVKGDKLATLQSDALDAQLAGAKSTLAQAESALAQANYAADTKSSGLTQAKAGLSSANSTYSAAVSSREKSKSALDKAEATLKASSAVGRPSAQAAVAAAESAYAQAKQGVTQAKLAVSTAKTTVSQMSGNPTGSAQDAAQAGVSAAEKAVSVAMKALNDATIKAPADGTVIFAPTSVSSAFAATGATVNVGDKLAKGSAVAPGSPLFSVVDSNKMSFTAEVDEADIERVKDGQTVDITLDAFTGKAFTGVISNIGTVAKTTTTGGTVFLVEMNFDTTDSALKLGMRGDSTIKVENVPDAITVPIEALFSEGGQDYVYVIKNNKLVKTNVKSGTTTDTSVEIFSGVKVGDKVALAGSTALSNGMTVKVK